MNSAVTPAESTLRRAKETISYLNDVVQQVQRGGAFDHEGVRKTINLCITQVETLLASNSFHNLASVQSNSNYNVNLNTVRARSTASENLTQLQRRRAQQVLSQLAIIENTLQRLRQKAQQKENYTTQIRNLLGSGGSSRQGERNKFSDLQQLERERQSLQYTRKRVQQMQSQSHAVLQALQDQGKRLSGTGEKMANMLQSIGVSNATVLQIIRRNQMDA